MLARLEFSIPATKKARTHNETRAVAAARDVTQTRMCDNSGSSCEVQIKLYSRASCGE